MNKYSDDYRHFDGLIWQAPAWLTGLLTAVLGGTAFLLSSPAMEVADQVGLPQGILAGGLLALSSLFFGVTYFAMFRWRVRQREVFNVTSRGSDPKRRFGGAQAWLQLVVGGQVLVQVLIGLFLLHDVGAPSRPWWHLGVTTAGLLALGGITARVERSIPDPPSVRRSALGELGAANLTATTSEAPSVGGIGS